MQNIQTAARQPVDQRDAIRALLYSESIQTSLSPLENSLKARSSQFAVFALDQSGKIVGRSSDSVHCLIDWNLSAK
jgi:hypothetical protein